MAVLEIKWRYRR